MCEKLCAGKYVGDKTSRAVGTAKDAAGTAEEVAVDGAHTVYNKAYDAAAAAGDKAGSAFRRVSSQFEVDLLYAIFRTMARVRRLGTWQFEVRPKVCLYCRLRRRRKKVRRTCTGLQRRR